MAKETVKKNIQNLSSDQKKKFVGYIKNGDSAVLAYRKIKTLVNKDT